MAFSVKDTVEHPEFGIGEVEEVLGDILRVNFFGEMLDVTKGEVTLKDHYEPEVLSKPPTESPDRERTEFRRAFEAINLGVVPPDPGQLIDLTIGAERWIATIEKWLDNTARKGLCKAVFGYYGAGKSHLLNLVRCLSLQRGWAVCFLEFDPKEADPARPHLVYRNLMSSIEFPSRADGTRTEGFFGFVKEVRDSWYTKSIRDLELFSASPWFSHGFEILIRYPHTEEQDYQSACNWLAGDYKSYDIINRLGRNKGYRQRVPRMPAVRENADIFVFNLAVVNELCKALGYKGLMIIFDEAEHVRGYSYARKERANNFFDILSRSAHRPIEEDPPYLNEEGLTLPEYWREGPHFGLFVGLTEGETFADKSLSLREACVFVHRKEDMIFLSPPGAQDYRSWCLKFLSNFYRHYPLRTECLKAAADREKIADSLIEIFEQTGKDSIILRNWTKLVGLVPCTILSQDMHDINDLAKTIKQVASQYATLALPWES